MKRTFKKSLALFLSAALLLSNSLVTSADNYEPTTSVEDTGGVLKTYIVPPLMLPGQGLTITRARARPSVTMFRKKIPTKVKLNREEN